MCVSLHVHGLCVCVCMHLMHVNVCPCAHVCIWTSVLLPPTHPVSTWGPHPVWVQSRVHTGGQHAILPS